MEHQSDKAAAQAVHRRVKAVLNTPQRPLYTLAEVTFKAQGIHRDRVSADRHQLSVDKLEGGTGMVAKLVCTMPAGPTLHKHDVEVEVERCVQYRPVAQDGWASASPDPASKRPA